MNYLKGLCGMEISSVCKSSAMVKECGLLLLFSWGIVCDSWQGTAVLSSVWLLMYGLMWSTLYLVFKVAPLELDRVTSLPLISWINTVLKNRVWFFLPPSPLPWVPHRSTSSPKWYSVFWCFFSPHLLYACFCLSWDFEMFSAVVFFTDSIDLSFSSKNEW